MPVVRVQNFKGIAPRVPARYLDEGQAQVALNCPVFSGSLQPLKGLSGTVHTLDKVGTPRTIYRYGQDTVSDTQYWFHWTTEVDVCRSQIAGDTSEWTFWTGDGAPKATYAAIALSGTNYPAASRPLGVPAPDTACTATASGSPDVELDPATATLTAFDISQITLAEGVQVSTTTNTDAAYTTVNPNPSTAAAVASAINSGVSGVTAIEVAGSVQITTDSEGENAFVYVRYRPDTLTPYTTKSGSGITGRPQNEETRVYVYTWVAKEAGYAMESAPSPASGNVTISDGQSVVLSNFDTIPTGGYSITNKRIYRSVSGSYFFVAEIGAGTATYTDTVDSDALAEELPSLFWAQAPSNMEGLTNLPNGMMAGFVGRDVYLCEPYRPHAWPEPYMQTVDYPVVGLGRMDTTLAVLTTGVPYLIQGTHPDSVAVVKSDLEQACVSKNSIVSFGSAVMYAAPDGLMLLSSSGSKIVTEGLFNFEQWQSYFKPESIHAYQHDNQYIAFYDNGVTRGGFIFEPRSGQFILHDIYAETGYRDLQRDKLFLAFDDRTIKSWWGGSVKSYTWKSKKFTMPEIMSFSCAQVEAEAYPVTMSVILDGTLLYSKVVSSRDPFRLPAKPVGRDWEIELQASTEVFSVALATSMTELANG